MAQPGDGERIGRCRHFSASARCKTGRPVLNHPGGGCAVLIPGKFNTVRGRIRGSHMHWSRTVRNQVDVQAVNIRVCIIGGIFIFEGDVMTSTSIAAKVDLFLHPGGCGVCRIDGIDRHERSGIVRIGHHTHNQLVCGIVCTVHKGGLQRVDGDGGIKLWRDGDVVGAGVTCVEVEGTHTVVAGAGDVGIGGASAGVGVNPIPTTNILIATCAVGVKVLSERQIVQRAALRKVTESSPVAVFTTAANTSQTDVVQRVGLQVVDRVRSVGNRALGNPVGVRGAVVFHFPCGLRVAGNPVHRDAVLRCTRDINVGSDTGDGVVARHGNLDVGTGGGDRAACAGAARVGRIHVVAVGIVVQATFRASVMSVEGVGVAIVATGVVVDGDDQVVGAVVLEGGREVERVPTLVAVHGTRIDQLQIGGIHRV